MDKDYRELQLLMEKAVMSAAAHLSAAASKRDQIEVHSKPDYTIVMNLDFECQKKIKDILSGSVPVLAEEDDVSHRLIGKEEDFFIVDPIDGTASCRRYLGIEGGQIGFGPMTGYVKKGKLKIAVYYNIPTKTLYSAVLGNGSYAVKIEAVEQSSIPDLGSRRKLFIKHPPELSQSAILFYPGSLDELKTIMHLRSNGLVENTYRLGGFANDSIRVAEGLEQIQLQTKVKAWDFPSTLIAREAGLKVIIDPYGRKIDLQDWVINKDNPVIVAHESIMPTLLSNLG